LFVSINKDKTNAELANMLSVKEFAIKMLKNQIAVFSAKQLKIIVDMIADYDRKIKVGEMKESVAIKTIVFNILNLRGK
jgi:DNA polymerase III delta subunit